MLGAVFGVAALAGTVGLGSGTLAALGLDTALSEADMWAMFGRAVVAMALWGAVGVGLGVLVPSQVGSIVAILAFTQFVERSCGRWPASWRGWARSRGSCPAPRATRSSARASSPSSGGDASSLEWWQGGLLLLAYAVVLTAVGYAITWRRDVT